MSKLQQHQSERRSRERHENCEKSCEGHDSSNDGTRQTISIGCVGYPKKESYTDETEKSISETKTQPSLEYHQKNATALSINFERNGVLLTGR